MLRLSTFCMLLGIVIAQNGYEYSKPGTSFNAGNTSNRPGYTPSGAGYPSSPAPTYPGNQPADDYSNRGSSSTPSFPGSSNYQGSNQGYPGSSSQRTQEGYNGERPSISSFPGQGPSETTQGGFPGQTGPSYSTQGQNYPEQPGQPGGILTQPGIGFGPTRPGFNPAGSGFSPPVIGADNNGAYEGGDYSAIPGEPDKDYPILSEVPKTSFRCDAQLYPGYYADTETRCQVFHVCSNNRTYDFLCPNGTIFSQQVFVCVWWNDFDCNSAPSLYELNANLYDYSIAQSKPQTGYPGTGDFAQSPQGPTYPGMLGFQEPSTSYPGISSPQRPIGPAAVYPGNSGSEGASAAYPENVGFQSGSSSYPGSSGSSSYPGSSGSQGSSTNYPGGSAVQTPSTGYLRPQDMSVNYPSPTVQGPPSYPSNTVPPSYSGSSGGGSQNLPAFSGNSGLQSYPDSSGSTPSYPLPQGAVGYPDSRPENNQGYPSGKPVGSSFPTGARGGEPKPFPQQPNREYLPPRN